MRNHWSQRWILWCGGGVVASALAWQAGPWAASFAQEPTGWLYSHDASEYPYDYLGDVTPEDAVPRSLADERVRQFDELDRPRFEQRNTHRGTQLNAERFTVVSATGEDDAELARQEFAAAWDEFARIADTFTAAHRNPDFAIGQLVIVIDDEPLRERDQPLSNLILQNGQTIVYLNVAEGQDALEDQLPKLRQAAVESLLHLAELDRKFPRWVQTGLAEYTADKIAQAEALAQARQKLEDEEGLEPDEPPTPDDEPEDPADEAIDAPDANDEEDVNDDGTPLARAAGASPRAALPPVGREYWRLQRIQQDELEEPEEADDFSEDFEKVRFLMEGDDGKHAPAFLLCLRALAQEPTDPQLASRDQLRQTQLLDAPTDTIVDELVDELQTDMAEWKADPLRGQPLFLPGGEIPDPAMLAREKEMEIVLKLARLVDMQEVQHAIRPRVTEFQAAGQQEIQLVGYQQQAINVDQLYRRLTEEAEGPWATLDDAGNLLLWTDEERLEELLGLEDDRYTSAWRDGHWVLVTLWDDQTQLEAWLEPNPNNPSRPLVKFAARPRETVR